MEPGAKLGKGGCHAVVTKPARVVCGGDKPAAERVHLREGANFTRIAIVVRVRTAGDRGAGGRLYRDNLIIRFAL